MESKQTVIPEVAALVKKYEATIAEDGRPARDVVIGLIIDATTGNLLRCMNPRTWDDEGERKVPLLGSHETFDEFLDFCADYDREPHVVLGLDDDEDFQRAGTAVDPPTGTCRDEYLYLMDMDYTLEQCVVIGKAWEALRQKFLTVGPPAEARLTVEALGLLARKHDIPFDPELFLGIAKGFGNRYPYWDASYC